MSGLVVLGDRRIVTLPGDLPKCWREVTADLVAPEHRRYRRVFRSKSKMMADVSILRLGTDYWRRVSFGYTDRMPHHFDIADVKRAFIGGTKKAFQIYGATEDGSPPKHTFNLHLFAGEDKDFLPEISELLGAI